MKKNPYEGPEWDEIEKNLFTSEEIKRCERKIQFPLALISLREKLGLTQREFSEKIDMKQPMLARIESGKNNPKINTVCKMLKPFGLSLAIVNESNDVIHVFEEKNKT